MKKTAENLLKSKPDHFQHRPWIKKNLDQIILKVDSRQHISKRRMARFEKIRKEL